MFIKQLIRGLVPLLLVYSCSHPADLKESPIAADEVKNPLIENQQVNIPVAGGNSAVDSAGPVVNTPTNTDWDKKIIKTASLRFEVKDFKAYNSKIHQAVKQFGGYIASEEQSKTDGNLQTTISIKVPVAQFETMMNQLSNDDVKVEESKITTEDVSENIVDTRSRLEAKKQMRMKYLEFLKQSKNMAEALEVQKDINSIQEDMESAAGHINYLSHSAAYSTINLTYYQAAVAEAAPVPAEEKPSFMARVSNSFMGGVHWLGELLVGLINVWPLFLLFFGVLYFIRKSAKGKKISINNEKTTD